MAERLYPINGEATWAFPRNNGLSLSPISIAACNTTLTYLLHRFHLTHLFVSLRQHLCQELLAEGKKQLRVGKVASRGKGEEKIFEICGNWCDVNSFLINSGARLGAECR